MTTKEVIMLKRLNCIEELTYAGVVLWRYV